MDGLRARGACGFEDAISAEVAVAGGGLTDVDGFVAGRDVAGVGVGIGVDRDRADAELAAGGGDPAGDFASVGDEELGDHGVVTSPCLFLHLWCIPCFVPCRARPTFLCLAKEK